MLGTVADLWRRGHPAAARTASPTPDLTAGSTRRDAAPRRPVNEPRRAQQAAARRPRLSLDATIAQLDAAQSGFDKAHRRRSRRDPGARRRSTSRRSKPSIKTLKAQVDAIAAGASGADAGAIAQNLADLADRRARASRRGSTASTRRWRRCAPISTRRARRSATTSTRALPQRGRPGAETAADPQRPRKRLRHWKAVPAGARRRSQACCPTSPCPTRCAPPRPPASAGPTRCCRNSTRCCPRSSPRALERRGDWTQNAVDWAKSLLALRPAERAARATAPRPSSRGSKAP